MSVSNDFLTKLDELMMFSDEPCLCSGVGACRKCYAQEALEKIYLQIEHDVDYIKGIPQSLS